MSQLYNCRRPSIAAVAVSQTSTHKIVISSAGREQMMIGIEAVAKETTMPEIRQRSVFDAPITR